jgi:hypothetical protein
VQQVYNSHLCQCGRDWDFLWGGCEDRRDADALLEGALAQLAQLEAGTRIDWTGREESSFAYDDGGDYLVIHDPDPGSVSRDEQGDTP